MIYLGYSISALLFAFIIFGMTHLDYKNTNKEHTTAISVVTYNDSANESLIMEKEIER